MDLLLRITELLLRVTTLQQWLLSITMLLRSTIGYYVLQLVTTYYYDYYLLAYYCRLITAYCFRRRPRSEGFSAG